MFDCFTSQISFLFPLDLRKSIDVFLWNSILFERLFFCHLWDFAPVIDPGIPEVSSFFKCICSETGLKYIFWSSLDSSLLLVGSTMTYSFCYVCVFFADLFRLREVVPWKNRTYMMPSLIPFLANTSPPTVKKTIKQSDPPPRKKKKTQFILSNRMLVIDSKHSKRSELVN